MHALLALSASHLEKLSSCGLTTVAQSHRLAAIKGLNSCLEKPLKNAEEGDAIIATCFALLMQSWYVDDGLESFLIITRSCEIMTKYVRAQDVGSVLAYDNSKLRVESMRSRLEGAPRFDLDFLRSTSQSLDALGPFCDEGYRKEMLKSLQKCIVSLKESSMEGTSAP